MQLSLYFLYLPARAEPIGEKLFLAIRSYCIALLLRAQDSPVVPGTEWKKKQAAHTCMKYTCGGGASRMDISSPHYSTYDSVEIQGTKIWVNIVDSTPNKKRDSKIRQH